MEQTCGHGFHIAVLQYQIRVVVVAVLYQLYSSVLKLFFLSGSL